MPALQGVKGISGRKFCKWVWVFTLWLPGSLKPLNPTAWCSRLMMAIDRMNTTKHYGTLDKFMDAIDAAKEEEDESSLRACKERALYIAKDVCNKKGRIISTPHGTINVDKMYEKLRVANSPDIGRHLIEMP
jgi:hypothetical protein